MKRWWIIFIITSLFIASSAFISTYLMTPIYEAKTQLLVYKPNAERNTSVTPIKQNKKVQENVGISNVTDNVEARIQMMQTYKDMIVSPFVADAVYQQIGDDIIIPNSQTRNDDITNLQKLIHVQVEEESQIMTLTVEHPDPEQAAFIADTIANTFKEETIRLLGIDTVQILSEAKIDYNPVQPNYQLNISISVLLGLLFSLLLVFALGKPKQKKHSS